MNTASLIGVRETLQNLGCSLVATESGVLVKGPEETLQALVEPVKTKHLPPLWPMQAKTLEAIRRLTIEKGYPPTVREIGAAIGLNSSSTVHAHMKALVDKGYIEQGFGKRCLRIIA